jgi:hypothetical protein
MTEHTPTADDQGEAISWLVGQLRWERVLSDLHDRAEGIEPVVPVVELPAEREDEQAA